MSESLIVINADLGETRVALVENGIIVELLLERREERSIVGNVYRGKVTRVLPGMQAAFVDIGLDRHAFLHVSDLIQMDDYDLLADGDDDEAENGARGGSMKHARILHCGRGAKERGAPDRASHPRRSEPNVPPLLSRNHRDVPAAADPPLEGVRLLVCLRGNRKPEEK